MRRLNRGAAACLRELRPHAVTDVTGFGLLGHLHEMLAASGVGGEVWTDAVPVLPDTDRLVAMGEVPGGTRSNLDSADRFTTWHDGIGEASRLVLADAQTSGGLLVAVPPDRARELVARLEHEGETGRIVGRVTPEEVGRIVVRRLEVAAT
jgi:selenide,water dikinase